MNHDAVVASEIRDDTILNGAAVDLRQLGTTMQENSVVPGPDDGATVDEHKARLPQRDAGDLRRPIVIPAPREQAHRESTNLPARPADAGGQAHPLAPDHDQGPFRICRIRFNCSKPKAFNLPVAGSIGQSSVQTPPCALQVLIHSLSSASLNWFVAP